MNGDVVKLVEQVKNLEIENDLLHRQLKKYKGRLLEEVAKRFYRTLCAEAALRGEAVLRWEDCGVQFKYISMAENELMTFLMSPAPGGKRVLLKDVLEKRRESQKAQGQEE